MNVGQLGMLILVGLVTAPGMLVAYGDVNSIVSPRGQVEAGIPIDEIACREGLQLMTRVNGDAICVSEDASQRLAGFEVALVVGATSDGTTYELMRNAVMSVNDALATYDEHGTDAFEMITSLNMEGTYPFVIRADTAMEVADGSVLDRRGQVTWSDIELEAALGNARDILDGGDGVWTKYVFLNPATDEDQAKMTWFKQHDSYLFGSGFYLEDQLARATAAEWSTKKAIVIYEKLGKDEAFATITAMESTKESYPFVIGMDNIVKAHGAIPSHVGDVSTISMLDHWDDVLAELTEMGMTVMEYVFINPATGNPEPKRSILVLHDGYIFGSGFYNPVE